MLWWRSIEAGCSNQYPEVGQVSIGPGPMSEDCNRLYISFWLVSTTEYRNRNMKNPTWWEETVYTEYQAFFPVVKMGPLTSHLTRMGELLLPLRFLGRRHTLSCGVGVGDPIPTKGETLGYSLYIYYNPSTISTLPGDKNGVENRKRSQRWKF
jgi:hypothetical protein